MAGHEQLAGHIYHERQEHGSALCAQHALNSLLRFSPSDLSNIAHNLDALEQHVDQGLLGRASANMDDTGFFSIQVLENALNVWDQNLIRWRSEAMQPYHDRPQDQRAFILNCENHWFTLRRFGNSENLGLWFNLDSSLDRPEWVSETYLGAWLQQAEEDGYSTFVVIPTDPEHQLPQTDADAIADSLSSRASSGARYPSTVHAPHSSAALENEDFELQAALQASLDGASVRNPMLLPHAGPVAGGSVPPPPVPHPSTRPADQPMANPVAASMARNQAMLERMRRQQEVALREHYHDEVSRFDPLPNRPSSRVRERVDVEDEEEQLRRAIAESEAMAREQGHSQAGGDVAGTTRAGSDSVEDEEWRPERTHGGRVYDDEDAELQAALQASLETAPPGAHTPNTAIATPPRAPAMRGSPLPAVSRSVHDDGDEDDMFDDETATEETLSDTAGPSQAESVNIEEMRRRRLARFGGP
ncbi:Josephin-domain-containing protein [Russula vinacea]|nr:Josephin-domain-containing protein [Russula vinacea]